MKNRILIIFLFILVVLTINACGAKRPVLYPNGLLKEIGEERAHQEIENCILLANEYQADSDRAKEIATGAGKAGVVGAATGAVLGAFSGNIGRTSVIGGAVAATAAMGSGIMRSGDPDPVFRQFVDHCLQEKGLQPLGWR